MIETHFGSPSNRGGSMWVLAMGTAAVWGTVAAIAASFACGVPATDALTFSLSLSSGIFANSAGNALLATNVHGPASARERNQRPDSSRYMFWSALLRNRLAVVLLTYSSC